MGFYHSTIDTVTDGRTATIGMTSKRAMFVNLQDAAGAALGTTANPLSIQPPASGALATNITQIGSTNIVTAGVAGTQAGGGNQATNSNVSTNVYPTLIAGSDYAGTPKIQNIRVDTSGYVQVKLPTWSVSSQTALTTTATVSGAAGAYGGGSFLNLNSVPSYIQIFDTTGAVTLGTTPPTFVQPIPANSTAANGSGFVFELSRGITIYNGIKIAATTTPTGATTVSTGLTGFIVYQ